MSRLEDLERRVEALERARDAAPTGPAAGAGAGADTEAGAEAGAAETDRFWALDGLRERTPEPAGRVLFSGVVGTPDGLRYEWQETRLVDDLLDGGWEDAAAALSALASPVRMQLLREVLRGRTSAAELVALDAFGTSGQVYHHLRQLTAAGWLRTAARGRYTVPPERVVPLLVAVAASR